MTYPRIFSLSTVGVLKHYVHDYLFHPLRTDFIGPNGVGKSIVADLLQLMFIYDTSLIRFGTDSVKKEDRSIYTLPYGLATAYCFLNVEVEADRFIIIGIVINSQTGSRITPFVITGNPELEKEINELALSADKCLFANDFTVGNRVPDLKSLAAKLYEERHLYLHSFRTKEDTKRYYQFLYDKRILSINLNIEEHLNAFAKVIQSFSKAKSLDLSPSKASKSLKQFLFDDSANDFDGEYRKQQGELERLLREFAALDTYIQQLTLKQTGLLQLKQLDLAQQVARRTVKIAEVLLLQQSIQDTKNAESDLMANLNAEKKNKKRLEEELAEFPDKKTSLKKEVEASQDYSRWHQAYQLAVEQKEEFQNGIIALKTLALPPLTPQWQKAECGADLIKLGPSQFKDLICEGLLLLEKFDSPADLEKAFDLQRDEVAKLSQSLKSKRQEIERLIEILQQNKEDSVIGWGVRRADNLSIEQKSLLLYFAAKSLTKPTEPKEGDQYIETATLLQSIEANSLSDATGFWGHFGPLREYISIKRDETSLFDTRDESKTVDQLLRLLQKQQKYILAQMQALDAAAKEKPFDETLLPEWFDALLVHYTKVEKVKMAACCIQQLASKIKDLEAEKAEVQFRIENIRSKLPSGIVYEEPEMVEKELKRIANAALERYTACNRKEAITGESLNKTEERIHRFTQELTLTTNTLLKQEEELANLRTAFFTLYGENIDEVTNLDELLPNLEKLETEAQQAADNYRIGYFTLVSQFVETNTSKHGGVNKELHEKSFDFGVLETALLGLKLKHTDQIAQELGDANRNRISMADSIKSTMVKVFERTVQTYKQHKDLVYTLNHFFQGVKISGRFFFNINFKKNEVVAIDLLQEIGGQVRNAAKRGELAFDRPVGDFIEEFFRKAAGLKQKIPVDQLLDPKTFFDLSVSLTDEKGEETSGSTGETYSAIALLGVARLSLVQREARKGLRFIILEELSSLDNTNFSTFPAIAKEFNYQIITMSPTPFRSSMTDEWYAHHLIKGEDNPNINHRPSASYFKTKTASQDLEAYLKLVKHELD